MFDFSGLEWSDAALVQVCLAFDSIAWNCLYDQFFAPLVAFLLAKLCQQPVVAEELAQTVLVSLCWNDHSRLRRFDPNRGTLASFLCFLARQEVRTRCRHSRPEVPVPPEELETHHAPDVLSPLELAELRANLSDTEREWLDSHCLGAPPTPPDQASLSPADRKRKQRLLAKCRDLLRNG